MFLESKGNKMSGIQLLLCASRGIYIPRDFVTSVDITQWEGISYDVVRDCENAENEYYWDSWEMILNNARYTDKNGNVWQLMQDGDLWAYCFELMTDEEKENFGFND